MKTRSMSGALIALLLLMLAGCSSYSIVSDYDRGMPFGLYKTYRWSGEGASGIDDDVLARNPLIFKHIKAAVNRELRYKGFVLKETGPVDFTVTTHAGIRERVTVGQPTVAFSYHRGFHHRGPGYATFWYDTYGPYPRVAYYEEGTLIIDVIDTKSDDLAWRGVVSGILRDYGSTDDMHHEIDTVVGRVLARFPPLSR
ncbi:MAG: DUF4136 domain-containing protein [Chlorobiaceae bacterium]|nr:DUF4136 domain-containing protein [Chlorobiaceae bacterium]